MVSKYITTALSIVEDHYAYAGKWDCAENEQSNSMLSTVEESDSSDNDFGTINIGTARFAITIKTHLIPCYSIYTETELKQCWYSPEEKDKMAAKRKRVISRMEAGKPESRRRSRSRPYRGLEHWMEAGSDRFTEQFDRIVAAVIDEQDDQWLKGLDDQDRIAANSRSVSAESVEAALHNAHQDAQETIKIHFALSKDTNACAEDDVATSATDKKAKKYQSRQGGKESSKNCKRSASR
jgi:hypothetical protein